MEKLNILKMKKTDFEKIPYRKFFNDKQPFFSSYVLIPLKKKHSSGWNCIKIIGCINDEPIVALTTTTDLLYTFKVDRLNIDCLPCGYLRLFCNEKMLADYDVSDFMIVTKEVY